MSYNKYFKGGIDVRSLLNTLEAKDPYAAAENNFNTSQSNLSAEQQRVQNVRNNVIPAAQSLHQRQQDILNEISPEHERANDYYNEMTNLSDKAFWTNWLPGEDINVQQELRKMQRSSEFPQILRNVLPNNGMYNVSQVDSGYDTDRGVYCTPYGCLPYQQAGATDVPNVISNPRFQAGVRNGTLPFESIPASQRSPGDISLVVGSAPNEYSNPFGPRSVRAHHTTIYAGDNNPGSSDPQSINAYSAYHGNAMDFKLHEQEREDAPLQFYRYVGQIPRMQNTFNNAEAVYNAIGRKPESSLPPVNLDPIARIDAQPINQNIQTGQLDTNIGDYFSTNNFSQSPVARGTTNTVKSNLKTQGIAYKSRYGGPRKRY